MSGSARRPRQRHRQEAAAQAAADLAHAEQRVRDAERNRLEQQEKQRLHDAECALVAAAASEAGRPRITSANATDWEPPQLEGRGADGECLYLIEERQYYGLRGQLGRYRNTNGFLLHHYLTHEQFCALPPSEQVLCRSDECKHKSQYPKCKWHCMCDGYERRDITRQMLDGREVILRTEIKYDCQWREMRSHPVAIDLSEAVLWYLQMTGDVWYSSAAAWPKRRENGTLDREGAMWLSDAHKGKYNSQVTAWKGMQEPCSSRKKRKRQDRSSN